MDRYLFTLLLINAATVAVVVDIIGGGGGDDDRVMSTALTMRWGYVKKKWWSIRTHIHTQGNSHIASY